MEAEGTTLLITKYPFLAFGQLPNPTLDRSSAASDVYKGQVTPLSQLQDDLAGVHALARLDLDRPHHARDRGANALL